VVVSDEGRTRRNRFDKDMGGKDIKSYIQGYFVYTIYTKNQ
jgi:hypothetical protein